MELFKEGEKIFYSPIHQKHLEHKARMIDFAGWMMPVQYQSILEEYNQTRNKTSLFDISHMGEFILEGDAEEIGLDKIVTQKIVNLSVGQSRYGMILNNKGGVIDDLIVFRLEDKKWFIVVNAATTQKDKEHFCNNLIDKNCFRDESFKWGKIDIQGPESRDQLKKIIPDIVELEYFQFKYFQLFDEDIIISRTGYTGELGYEIFIPWEKTEQLWDTLLDLGDVQPAGLGARDILRLEKGYSLYGNEISEKISPIEAGLNRFIDWNKDFIGKEIINELKQEETKRVLVGIISENRQTPKRNQKIYLEDDKEIGFITSGCFSPILKKGIGLGYIDKQYQEIGKKIFFGNDKKKILANISKKIFYNQGSLKK